MGNNIYIRITIVKDRYRLVWNKNNTHTWEERCYAFGFEMVITDKTKFPQQKSCER